MDFNMVKNGFPEDVNFHKLKLKTRTKKNLAELKNKTGLGNL